MIPNVALTYSIVSGLMACLLFIGGMFFEKDKKKSKFILIWGCLFLAGSFAGIESALWSSGYNMFNLILNFNFPLTVYFIIWFTFIIWLFETRKERKVWIILLILLIVTTVIAMNCMNCLHL
jgi:hypothetical protein